MNRQLLSIVWPLFVINVAALVLWLAANRFRVVLIGPPGRGLREIGLRGYGLLYEAIRKRRFSRAAAAQPRTEDLDAWIDEVERQETRSVERRPGPATDAAEGSAAWWKAFADSGGALPGAAGSCRRRDADGDRTAAIL